MSSEPVISLRHVFKTYRAYQHPLHGLAGRLTGGRLGRYREFHALEDINLDIYKGETVGIVGRNGSGKSTLLQIICGIRKPTSGYVNVKGRVSALLELGSGFQPEFTGRENIYLQGAIMGFTRLEMEEKFDEIASFADIGEYIEQPVKSYSSGMFVRLAFATAINTDPDIFIVDEALSVGDFFFQQKCIHRIRQLINNGVSLLIVSHDKSITLSICSRAILFDAGHVLMEAKPKEVIDYYQALLTHKHDDPIERNVLDTGQVETISGTGEAVIENVCLLNSLNRPASMVLVGEMVTIEIVVRINQDIPRLVLGMSICDRLGQVVYGINTHAMDKPLVNVKKGERHRYKFGYQNNLGIGMFSVSTTLLGSETHVENNYESREATLTFNVINSHDDFHGNVWLNVDLEIDQLSDASELAST